jgi:hypothetical protein
MNKRENLLPVTGVAAMILDDILQDIYALEDEARTFERKYGVLSETFYESYVNGEEPHDEAWVRDWTAWASAYKLLLRWREQYHNTIQL